MGAMTVSKISHVPSWYNYAFMLFVIKFCSFFIINLYCLHDNIKYYKLKFNNMSMLNNFPQKRTGINAS